MAAKPQPQIYTGMRHNSGKTEEDARILIYGCTVFELCKLFSKTSAEVVTRLENVTPNITARGVPLYRIKDAAPYLTVPRLESEIVERVMKMSGAQLPPNLRKEYWQAKEAQLRVTKAEGDLWDTYQIIEYLSLTFKNLRLSLQLMSDAVEREGTLTEKQRLVIQNIVDSTLNDARERLVNAFEDRKRKKHRGQGEGKGESNGRRVRVEAQEEDPYADL